MGVQVQVFPSRGGGDGGGGIYYLPYGTGIVPCENSCIIASDVDGILTLADKSKILFISSAVICCVIHRSSEIHLFRERQATIRPSDGWVFRPKPDCSPATEPQIEFDYLLSWLYLGLYVSISFQCNGIQLNQPLFCNGGSAPPYTQDRLVNIPKNSILLQHGTSKKICHPRD